MLTATFNYDLMITTLCLKSFRLKCVEIRDLVSEKCRIHPLNFTTFVPFFWSLLRIKYKFMIRMRIIVRNTMLKTMFLSKMDHFKGNNLVFLLVLK